MTSTAPTRNFISLLPSGFTTSLFADECRSAALGFVAGAPSWDKRQLAQWLHESYRPLVVGQPYFAPAAESPLRRLVRPMVDARQMQSVVDVARQTVVTVLSTLNDGAAIAQFGACAIRSGLVHRSIDEQGEPAWAPRATPRIKLVDRVLSLFAADCLARPWEYETLLHVCVDCNAVRMVEQSSCCSRQSGVMLRGTVARESAA
jgi:hypothetical protein